MINEKLMDALIPIEHKAYSLAGEEYEKRSSVYSFDNLHFYFLAKLVIEECAETVQDFVDHRFPASEYSSRLKHYFGVE